MRNVLQIGLLFLLVISLAACGADSTPTASAPTRNPDAEPTPTREEAGVELGAGGEVIGDAASDFGLDPDFEAQNFFAYVEGALTRNISGEGYFACENGQYALRPSASGLEQVTFLLPPDITPGTYSLGTQGSAEVAALVSLEDNRVFAGGVSGTLILNFVADAPGEIIAGTFNFQASNNSETVSVSGEFEFTSAATVPYCE